MDKRKCSEFVDTQSNLGVRVKVNNLFGDNDLTAWLTKHLRVRRGEHILDVGCGDGNHLRQLAPIVGSNNYCIGIDYDPEMIKKAKLNSKNFKPKIAFLQMDMDTVDNTNSPFSENSFDLIYSAYAFYYSKNEKKTLDKLKKILKAGGRIAILGPRGDNNKDWFIFLNQFMKLPKSIIASSTTFMDAIYDYAKKNFLEVHSYEFVNNITFPSYRDMEDYWISNIYFEPKYNAGFKKYARKHFTKHKHFAYSKKAQLVIMQGKKELYYKKP